MRSAEIIFGSLFWSEITTISEGKIGISADNNLGQGPGSATAGFLVLNGGSLFSDSNMTLNSAKARGYSHSQKGIVTQSFVVYQPSLTYILALMQRQESRK